MKRAKTTNHLPFDLDMNGSNTPVVRIDKSLNKYTNQVLFPEKVKKAKQAFEKLGLPGLKG